MLIFADPVHTVPLSTPEMQFALILVIPSFYETIHQTLQVINYIFEKLFCIKRNHCTSDLVERTYSTRRRHDFRTSTVRFFDF
jgi:hypothetical protein